MISPDVNVLRVLTNPRVSNPPMPMIDAAPMSGTPGAPARDAYHAALAIEHGTERISTDRDFARFPRLRWRSPVDCSSWVAAAATTACRRHRNSIDFYNNVYTMNPWRSA